MPFTDPEKKKAYQRQYMRQRRSGAESKESQPSGRRLVPGKLDPNQLETAQGLFAVLRHAIIETANCRADSISKARAIGYLVNIGFKGLESTDFEGRLQTIEDFLHKGRP